MLNLASTLAIFCSDGYFPRDMGRKPSGIYLHGHVVSWIPLMLFVILSGLSLDLSYFGSEPYSRVRCDRVFYSRRGS